MGQKSRRAGVFFLSFVFLLFMAGGTCFSGQSEGQKVSRMRVTFINPGISDSSNPTGTFWLSVSAFMQAAADDLGVELEIIYSERDHILMREQARAVALKAYPPDAVIVVNEKLAAEDMVKILDQAGIKVFLLLNSFVEEQRTEMGKPRARYRSYLGALVPDNLAAGDLLARILFNKAKLARNEGGRKKIEMIAINGDYVTPAAIARNNGLQSALRKFPEVDLRQVFVGQWSKEKAHYQTHGALTGRYPKVSVIWAANDPMALGALGAARESGKMSGRDIFVGGINWDLPALHEVRDGGLVASVGGHFMTGGWALVLLYDYLQGRDFAEIGTELELPLFSALDQQSVGRYLQVFGDGNWSRIDFRKFSKALNPDLQRYEFNLEGAYNNLEQ